jgi:hypothetical protein
MKEWERSSRKLSLQEIPPEFKTEIHKHLKSFNLGPILDDYQICLETVSHKKKMRFLDLFIGSKLRVEVAILTPSWLVIGTRGEKIDSAGVLSVQLKEAEVMDHRDHPGYDQLPDTGLHITGIFTGRVGMYGNQRISCYLGLGDEPAAREFRDLLFQGIQNTRK